MPINNTDRLHGAAVFKLFEALGKKLPSCYFSIDTGESSSAYLLTGIDPARDLKVQVGLFIKLSNKRLSPWGYSFHQSHQDELLFFKEKCGEAFSIFVNSDDGFACLNFTSMKEVLDDHHEEQEWVSVSRKPKQAYRISGNDGKLERPVPVNAFPEIIVGHFENEFKSIPSDSKRELFSLKGLANLFSRK